MRVPRLARHSAVYVAVPIAQRVVYFLLIPVFTRYFSPSDYGAWGYASVVGTMLGTFGPLGFFSAYAYALRRPGEWRNAPAAVRRAALQGAVVLVALASVLVFPIARRVNLGVVHGDLLWLLVLAATFTGFLVQAAKRRHQMLEEPRRFAWLELTTGLTTAAASLVAVVVLGWGVLGLAAGLLAGAAVGVIPAVRSLRIDLFGLASRESLGEAFAYGFPLFFHAGAAIMLQYVDRFMLERMSTLPELGIYSLAGQLATAMTIVATSTNQAYMPFLYRHFDLRPRLIARAQAYVAAFFATAAIGGILAAPFFIRHFIDPEFARSSFPTQLLLAGGMFHGFYYLMLGRLLVLRRTRTAFVVTAAATALNVALNYRLIPMLAAEGAAWATLVSEFCLFAAMWYFSRGALTRSPGADVADRIAAGS